MKIVIDIIFSLLSNNKTFLYNIIIILFNNALQLNVFYLYICTQIKYKIKKKF